MKIITSLFVLLISFSIMAEETEKNEVTETKYRYPSELSVDEHNKLIQSRDYYDACLKKEVEKNLDKYEDFRKIADVAMEDCKKTLEEIHSGLTKMNLDPDFIRFFLYKTSQKSAQKILPEIMMLKAE